MSMIETLPEDEPREHGRDGARTRRRLLVVFGSVGAVALLCASVAVPYAMAERRTGVAAELRDRRLPFDEAFDALASAAGVEYHAERDGMTADLTIARGGSGLGSMTVDGERVRLAAIAGRWFATLPPSQAREFGVPAGLWVTGENAAPGQSDLTGSALRPTELAARLMAAVNDPRTTITAPGDHGRVGDVDVITARTPVGVVHVTAEVPHMVVRVAPDVAAEPEDDAGGVQQAAWRPARAATPVGDQLTVVPMDLKTRDRYDAYWVVATIGGMATAELKDAVSGDDALALVGTPQVECARRACSAIARVRAERADAAARIRVLFTATITVDGKTAGTCSAQAVIPGRGTAEVRCASQPAAKALARARSAKKAQALRRSAALGGAVVRWQVGVGGQVRVRPLGSLDVAALVRTLEEEQAVIGLDLFAVPGAGAHGCSAAPKGAVTTPGGWVSTSARKDGLPGPARACASSPGTTSAPVAGAVQPAGWDDAVARIRAWGLRPEQELGRCRLVPMSLGGGDGVQNLSPCFRDEVAGRQSGLTSFEEAALRALKAHPDGHLVLAVHPMYAAGPAVTSLRAPQSFVLTYRVYNSRGRIVDVRGEMVQNSRVRGGVLRRLGGD